MVLRDKKKIFFILFPLLLGVLIYVFFRSRNLFYYNFFHVIDIDEQIREYRIILWRYRKSIPNWVIYSLPDGLWLYSFGIAFLYGSKFFFLDSLIFGGITIFMIGFEFFQMRFGGHGTLFGTFDMGDIYCFIGGFILVLLTSFFSIRNLKVSPSLNLKNYCSKALFQRLLVILCFFILAILPTLFKF